MRERRERRKRSKSERDEQTIFSRRLAWDTWRWEIPTRFNWTFEKKKKDLNLRKVFQYFYFACEIIFRIKIDNYFVTVIFDIILEKTSLLWYNCPSQYFGLIEKKLKLLVVVSSVIRSLQLCVIFKFLPSDQKKKEKKIRPKSCFLKFGRKKIELDINNTTTQTGKKTIHTTGFLFQVNNDTLRPCGQKYFWIFLHFCGFF